MQYKVFNAIKKLTRQANELDKKGQYKQADLLDQKIKRLASGEFDFGDNHIQNTEMLAERLGVDPFDLEQMARELGLSIVSIEDATKPMDEDEGHDYDAAVADEWGQKGVSRWKVGDKWRPYPSTR
jgi:hypothetical protein